MNGIPLTVGVASYDWLAQFFDDAFVEKDFSRVP
jgi:hypothetical protein